MARDGHGGGAQFITELIEFIPLHFWLMIETTNRLLYHTLTIEHVNDET